MLSALEHQGFLASDRPDLDALRIERFVEYAGLMQAAGQDPGGGLIRVTGRAWRYISNSETPSLMGGFTLGAICGATGEALRGLGQRLTILTR